MTSKAYRGPTCMVYSTSRTLHCGGGGPWNLEVRKETKNFLGLPNRGLMGSREEDRVCRTCWPMIWKSRLLIWLDPLLMGRPKWTLIFKYANFMIRDVLKHIEHDPTINLKWPKRRDLNVSFGPSPNHSRTHEVNDPHGNIPFPFAEDSLFMTGRFCWMAQPKLIGLPAPRPIFGPIGKHVSLAYFKSCI